MIVELWWLSIMRLELAFLRTDEGLFRYKGLEESHVAVLLLLHDLNVYEFLISFQRTSCC